MERILVGLDASRPSWDSLLRALCLAPRIDARALVLLVFGDDGQDRAARQEVFEAVKARVASARAAGTLVELATATGRFDTQVMNAARRDKTTLLVAASPDGQGEREAQTLSGILAGVDCRVELVSPKRNQKGTKDVSG